MFTIFFRYVYIVVGFSILALLPYSAYKYDKYVGPVDVMEYLVPALIFFALAYRSYPRTEQKN
jgi:hypothetical protein